MRFGLVAVLSASLGMVAACGGSFQAGGSDAGDENPGISGGDDGSGEAGPLDATTPVDAVAEAAAQDAATQDAAAQDATADGADAHDGAAEAEAGCPTGDLECSGTCVPNDVDNCGTCGNSCTSLPHVSGTTTCTASGACEVPPASCATGWSDCDGNPTNGCETDITKSTTCGSCTNACTATDPVCSGTTCVTGCGTEALCSGSCVDTTSAPNDCGECGKECTTSVANAQATCAKSVCGFNCNTNYTGCPTAAPTECVNEQTDPNNCKGCGTKCPAPTTGTGTGAAACSAGKCTLNCNAGLTACPAAPAEPTECTNTASDVDNCGSCGEVCPAAPTNATVACTSSGCGFNCDGGFQLCNGACIQDADTTNGVFVSPSGSASNTTCTEAAPCTTIAAAIATGKTVIYLDKGTYTEQVKLPATALTIHGGWTDTGGTWTNCGPLNTTSIIAAPTGDTSAVTNAGNGLWTLDTMTIRDENTATAGQSLYGIFLTGGNVTVENIVITVAQGGAGAAVGAGGNGTAAPASCTQGSSTVGATGTSYSTASAGNNAVQGVYSAAGFTPGNGTMGTAGTGGGNGGPGNPSTNCSNSSCYFAPNAAGCDGALCCGSSTSSTECALNAGCTSQICGLTGGVGCGGGGGGAGPAGNGGGSSIGIFAANTTVNLGAAGDAGSGSTGVTITVGSGGTGSAGGNGGTGASGNTPVPDDSIVAPTSCTTKKSGSNYLCETGATGVLEGGTGSTGGNGGNGGPGGGGAGGDSLCYATFGTTDVTGTPTCTSKQAAAGAGGAPNGRAGLHN